MLRIIKKIVSKKGRVFHASDNHSNREVNVDVISNVMTFLTLCFKVQTVYSFKHHIFMKNVVSSNFQDSFQTVHSKNVCK